MTTKAAGPYREAVNTNDEYCMAVGFRLLAYSL